VTSGVDSTSASIALASVAEMFVSVSLVFEVSPVEPTPPVPLDSPMLVLVTSSSRCAARAARARG
jgi:hypothetical protein